MYKICDSSNNGNTVQNTTKLPFRPMLCLRSTLLVGRQVLNYIRETQRGNVHTKFPVVLV